MAILKFKDENNQWQDLVALRGRDGVIQYQAGTGITIEGNVISAIQQDLTNYYTKSEVNGLIEAIETVSLDVEQTLPVTGEPNVIYLVPSSDPGTQNAMDEYIYVNNAWEKIGSTAVDLSNYVTKTEVPVFLAWDGTTGSTTAVKEFFQQVIDAHAEGKDVFVVGRKANSNLVGELIYILRKNDTVQTSSPYNYYQMLGTATASVSQNSYNHSSFSLNETNINIYGQLSNGRFVVNNVITSEAGYQLDYLDIQHVYNAAYTPTHDYNPATKKYVDDAVASITPTGAGDMLKSVYDTDDDGKVDAAEDADTVNGHTVNADVPSNAVFTDTTYNNATTSSAGLMSATDKTSLNALVTAVGSVSSTDVTNWNTAANNSHTHGNKSLLDAITSGDVTNWNTAVTNSHSHSNKTVLDGISSSDITNWNKVHIYSGTATPGAGTGEDGDIYVKYTA